ncbi:MAG TPA: peptide transporter, partial [Candidatus Methanomethylophilaceae archaeon]|nr:peptide transporter [Candidatus Methanomethylophilaceae archaeon]
MSAKERVTAKERARSRTDGHHEAHLALTGKHTLLVLAAIVLLAFFLRSFFAYGPSISNGFALSGGSDAVYYQRVIDHIVSTGQQLVNDPLLNYPYDSANPREPLYAWVVAVGGMFLTLFGIPTETAVGMSFVFSTAIFGALACIPVYLIARETFGNRTGLIAAALMAISAAAISPSVLSNGDHDAMAMFFILWTFYFFLRAFTKVKGSRWVEDWRSLRSIKEGLKAFVRENRVGILYAFLAGISLALVSLTWKGFVYAMAILVIFLLVQLLIDRFSNRDSMPVAILFAVTGVSWALLSLPYYLGMGFINTWWDLPAYLVLGGLIISVYFTVTRDKPWTLAIPGFVLVVIAGLAFLALFLPHVLEGLISGQGYFVQSKLYSTIAEAQAPSFSSLAMSYGVATIWLAIVGAIYAVIQIPRVKKPAYVFIVVWLVVAMFMASSAQRFVFNGAVAFAIAAAVAIDLLLRKVDLRSYYKDIGSADWRRKWREVLKPVPLLTVLFMTFLVLAPNVWVAVDASMPNNTKADYDKQIYDAMPSFLQPDDYEYGNLYYLGSRGSSIYTEKNWNFFDAFDWLSQQDSDIYPESERPAFLSWWDYGFEAITYGAHPTVADNFQNGYNMAANFITAQSEEEAIALFIVRILETERFSNETRSVLADHGINPDALEDRIFNSGNYINTILANPSVYGSYSDDLSAANARYIESSHYLTSRLDGEGLASLYHNLRDTTGNDIAYFAVDTRLFPWSVNSMGIFSAPAKLSDHVIDEFGVPSDFYEIYAYLSDGSYVPISELKQG